MLAVSSPHSSANTALRVEIVDTGAVAPDFVAAWAALAANAAEPNCFAESWFVLPALEHLHEGADVRLLSIWADDDLLIGIVPLASAKRYGRTPVRHTVNWLSTQSFYGAPLIRAGWVKLFWSALIDALDGSDWAPSFLSVSGLDENGPVHQGLRGAVMERARNCPVVYRQARALLSSGLAPEAYLDHAIRSKKRKELRRQRNRLEELGAVTSRAWDQGDDLGHWTRDFLALESAGWKGREGAAFANTQESAAFFKSAIEGAAQAGALDMVRLDLDGRPIAMLINFLRRPGSFSFKIAYDEGLARFSPGVLLELENLRRVLDNPVLGWMDSCAAADHPMINSLWAERRSIVQVSVPLKGVQRRAIFVACRALERGAAAVREWRGR